MMKSLRSIIIAAALCLISAPALACTKAQFVTPMTGLFAQNFPNNTTGLISEPKLRNTLSSAINCSATLDDPNTFSLVQTFSVNPIFSGIPLNALIMGGGSAASSPLQGSANAVPYWDGSAILRTGLLPNSSLANSTITVNGVVIPLGGSGNPTATATSITPGTTTVGGSPANGCIFNNTSGVVQCGPVTNAQLANSSITISGVTVGLGASGVLNSLTFGTHLAAGGSSYNGSAAVTITSDATNANTASTIVARDGSGNFSAGTITASLTGLASLNLALTGGTISGNLTTNGILSPNSVSSVVGLSTNPSSYWQFVVGETWAGGSGFGTPFVVQDTMGNGGTGNRQAATIQMFTGYGGNSNDNYVAIGAFAENCGSLPDSKRNSNCAGQLGGGSGHFNGVNTSLQADNGSGLDTELAGIESDMAVRDNSGNVERKVGIQLISVPNDLYHASISGLDDAILIDGGGVGFDNGIFIGYLNNGVSSGGTLFATGSGTYQNGIYLTNATIVSSAFASNGFNVDGSGHLFATLPNSSGTNPVCWTSSTKEFSFSTSCTASDERLKLFDGPLSDPLWKLVSLARESHFGRFHGAGDDGLRIFGRDEQIGLGAQTLARYFPELARKNADGVWSADYDKLTVPIIGALGEMQAENDIRDQRIANLETANDNLRREVNQIRRNVRR